MKKRILALLLCLILTATVCAVPAFAENTVTVEEAVQSILNDMSNTDDSCTNASQQAANGAYSLAEMLHLGAMMKAENEQQSDMLNSILDGMYTTDKSTTDAEQQLANGAYGISSLLIAIATMMDEEGNFGEDIRRISERMLDQYSQNDNAVETVYQQQANCAQRIFEFLQVIAVLNDRENAYAEQIDALEDGLIEADHAADNATAQVAASLYFSTRMAGIIAFEFDA